MANKSHCSKYGIDLAKAAIALAENPKFQDFGALADYFETKSKGAILREHIARAVNDHMIAKRGDADRTMGRSTRILMEMRVEAEMAEKLKVIQELAKGEAPIDLPPGKARKFLNDVTEGLAKERRKTVGEINKANANLKRTEKRVTELKGQLADAERRKAEKDYSKDPAPAKTPRDEGPEVEGLKKELAAANKELHEAEMAERAEAQQLARWLESAEKRGKREKAKAEAAEARTIEQWGRRAEKKGASAKKKSEAAEAGELLRWLRHAETTGKKAKARMTKAAADELARWADYAEKTGQKERADKLRALGREDKRLAELRTKAAGLQRRLDAKDFSGPDLPPKPKAERAAESPAVKRERERVEALQKQMREAEVEHNAAKREAKRWEDKKAAIADINKAIASGDVERLMRFAPQSKKVRDLTHEQMVIEFQLKRSRARARRDISELDKHWTRKLLREVNLNRVLMATGELSTVLRQGAKLVTGDVISKNMGRDTARAVAQGSKILLKGLITGDVDLDVAKNLKRMRNDPYFEDGQLSGLFLSDNAGQFTDQEEFVASTILQAVAGSKLGGGKAQSLAVLTGLRGGAKRIEATQEAASIALNILRQGAFSRIYSGMGGRGAVDLDAARGISEYVNITSGRGDLGRLQPVAEQLNVVMFAPRFVMSRFQTILLPLKVGLTAAGLRQNIPGKPAYTKEVQKMYVREYLKYAGALATVYTLGRWAGGETEDDPLSSDFGKLRFGNTRLDVLSGFAQPIRYTWQFATGEAKSLRTGKTYDKERSKTVSDFLRGKSSPSAGMAASFMPWAIDTLRGKETDPPQDFLGRNITPEGFIENYFLPITYRDVLSIGLEEGWDKGTIYGVLAFLGIGIQNFDANAPRPKNQEDESIIFRPMLDAMKGESSPDRQLARR